MKLHPFSPDRHIGAICRVEGLSARVTLSAGRKLPRVHLGQYVGRGEVGEFVVVDVGGSAAFGRILGVSVDSVDPDPDSPSSRHSPVEGQIQLLSTLGLDGNSTRGILRYPRIGDPVYAASSEAILAVLGSRDEETQDGLTLGSLSIDDHVNVRVPLGRLFGRHLAIVGATGSGKSWTLAHLAESVARINGKMLLIDATGEFRTLGDAATHFAFGSLLNEPPGAQLVAMPHYMMRESDRNAFFNPASGSQLPKFREAIRSLRLAKAISDDPDASPQHRELLSADGTIRKAGMPMALHGGAVKSYRPLVEGVHSNFDLTLMADQIQHECIWPTDRSSPEKYGASDFQQLGYCISLISRVRDTMQTAEITDVINPPDEVQSVLSQIDTWILDDTQPLLRLSLQNLTYENSLREVVVNIIGRHLLALGRAGSFRVKPLVVAVDEAHQFFDVTVGDEHASTRLNAFDAIAKEGRKYGLTVCLATQRPGDLPSGVLSQVGMSIVHRLADGRDRQRVEQAAAELDHSATRLLPGLVPGEAILMGVDFPVPVSIRVSRPIAPPASDGPRYQSWRFLSDAIATEDRI